MRKIRIIELTLSIISSWWAIVLFKVPQMFDRQPATYQFFKDIASESQWAIVFMLAALVKIVGMIINVKSMRRVGLIMSVMIYLFIACSYFFGIGWLSIGFGTFLALSFMALWGALKVGDKDA